MVSRLHSYADALLEAVWLTALVAAPLFFNRETQRIFEPDKVALVRSLAWLALAVWIVKRVDGFGAAPATPPLWRRPLVPLVLALAGVYVLSASLSVVPRQSWLGSYQRQQGALTMLSYLVLFLVALDTLRTHAMWQRLRAAILTASAPVALYGIVQHTGLDPLRWGADTTMRVTSTLGNAIFMAAYLILAVPLTIERLIQSCRRPTPVGRVPRARILTTALLFALLALQLTAILFTQSRGPWLGLAAGLYIFLLLGLTRLRRPTVPPRRRWLGAILGLGIGAVGLAALIGINTPHSRAAGLRSVPYLGNLARMLDADTGTGRSRVLIWDGAVAMLKPHAALTWPDGTTDRFHPLRLWVGHGPESMWVAYGRFFTPTLATVEARTASPDRAHNETFDSLLTTGLLGFLVQSLLIISIGFFALKWLGLIASRRERHAFIAILAATGLLGVGLPAARGHLSLAGVGFPFGLLLGLVTYIIAAAWRGGTDTRPPEPRDWAIVTLLAAIVAHGVEIQFGIAITPTRTTCALLVAALVAIGTGQIQLSIPPAAPPPPPHARHPRSSKAPSAWRTRLPLVCILGIVTVILALDFAAGGQRPLQPSTSIAQQAMHAGQHITILSIWLGLGILALAASLVELHAGLVVPWCRRPARTGITALLLAGGGLVLIDRLNLDLMRADAVFKLARQADIRGDHVSSRLLYDTLSALAPHQDFYQLHHGAAHLDEARATTTTTTTAARQESLDCAGLALRAARTLNPLNPDHSANLARFHTAVAALERDPDTRRQALCTASVYYAQATALSPGAAHLQNEWADVFSQLGDQAQARDRLLHSLTLDPHYADTYVVRAELALGSQAWDAALADFDRAAAQEPLNARALRGRAYALAQLGRTEESIADTLRAVALDPRDVTSLKNLAMLYAQQGKPAKAREFDQRARDATRSPGNLP